MDFRSGGKRISNAVPGARLRASAVWNYGLTVLSVAISLAITFLLQPYVFRTPFFFLSIMLSTWFCGKGPGLLAVFLSTLSIYFILNPQGTLTIRFADVTNLAAFLFSALLVGSWSAARRRAEEALRESERRFRTFVDHARDAFFLHDETGVILDVNRYACESLGYSRDELIGMTPLDFDPDVTPADIEDMDRQLNDVGKTIAFESRHRRKDGTVFAVEVRGQAYWEGGRRFSVSLARDITARKQAQQALQQAHNELELKVAERTAELRRATAELKTILDASPVGIALLGRDGTVQRCNPAFERIVGWRAEEIKGRPVSLVKAQQDQSSAFAEELNCSGAVANVETRLVRKDGSEFDASISYAPLQAEAGGPAGFVAAVQDISDRKRAEEALRRTQAYLAEGQRLSHTGSWHWSVSTGEFVWSQEFFAIFGFDPEKDKPSYQLFVERIDPEDRPTIEEVLWAAVGERKDFDVEYRLVLPEGLIKHLHTIGHFVVSQSDDVEYIGTVIDITERKRAEEERERLRQAQADLAHINRVTTMGELTASLAHEIRQPITAAMTNAQSCLRWLGRDQPDLAEAHEAASRIVKDVTRASEIISRIRLLFKKGTPQRELLDVNEVIQEMIALLRNEASRYSISIRCDLANDLPKAMADRVQLQQVFMNLMLNGIEAMKDIGPVGELTIKSQQGDNRQLLISVGDTGVGLQPEQAEQIFNAFFTTNPQGTGMGLPISRSIIESHGGRLWATAHSGQGATFHFTLPSEGGVSGCAASYS